MKINSSNNKKNSNFSLIEKNRVGYTNEREKIIQFMGDAWYSMATAVTFAIILMTVTKTLHPPGGATALVCVMQHSSYSFVFMPIFIGVVILILVAILVNNISPHRNYPK